MSTNTAAYIVSISPPPVAYAFPTLAMLSYTLPPSVLPPCLPPNTNTLPSPPRPTLYRFALATFLLANASASGNRREG